MTASLASGFFPSISKIIKELDGEIPGISLLKIVRTMPWVKNGDGRIDEGKLTLGFIASLTEYKSPVQGSFTVRSFPRTRSKIPETFAEIQLRMSIKETDSLKLILDCKMSSLRRSPGIAFNGVLTRLFLKGGDDLGLCFPIWGYPHPDNRSMGVCGHLSEYARRAGEFPDISCERRMGGGAMFLALVTLGLSVNWASESLGPLLEIDSLRDAMIKEIRR